jgi:hypothetical protein
VRFFVSYLFIFKNLLQFLHVVSRQFLTPLALAQHTVDQWWMIRSGRWMLQLAIDEMAWPVADGMPLLCPGRCLLAEDCVETSPFLVSSFHPFLPGLKNLQITLITKFYCILSSPIFQLNTNRQP